mmetsp:Transcript_4543/g.12426  ORF Transcript_4543/g.12426 Transcript_4543/m.12426 type:complete len:329 (-) Transcript_4543:829-1815(-)
MDIVGVDEPRAHFLEPYIKCHHCECQKQGAHHPWLEGCFGHFRHRCRHTDCSDTCYPSVAASNDDGIAHSRAYGHKAERSSSHEGSVDGRKSGGAVHAVLGVLVEAVEHLLPGQQGWCRELARGLLLPKALEPLPPRNHPCVCVGRHVVLLLPPALHLRPIQVTLRHMQHVGVAINDRIPLQMVNRRDRLLQLASDAYEQPQRGRHAHGLQPSSRHPKREAGHDLGVPWLGRNSPKLNHHRPKVVQGTVGGEKIYVPDGGGLLAICIHVVACHAVACRAHLSHEVVCAVDDFVAVALNPMVREWHMRRVHDVLQEHVIPDRHLPDVPC